jgi:transcriptional/translational regulatory protein YebC/TACO1
VDEEELMELAIEAGAEDVVEEEGSFRILTAPDDFNDVVEALEKAEVKMDDASISMVPQNTVEVTEEKPAKNLLTLLDNLEDHDDVQKVHANFDIPDEIIEALS